mmetsp:Transcript_96591/g.270399  ORF Transcript_96591/g.270399 Transcript_96591/m.270399 type:complete len:232 (-) Transcript_96591:220-915(-)
MHKRGRRRLLAMACEGAVVVLKPIQRASHLPDPRQKPPMAAASALCIRPYMMRRRLRGTRGGLLLHDLPQRPPHHAAQQHHRQQRGRRHRGRLVRADAEVRRVSVDVAGGGRGRQPLWLRDPACRAAVGAEAAQCATLSSELPGHGMRTTRLLPLAEPEHRPLQHLWKARWKGVLHDLQLHVRGDIVLSAYERARRDAALPESELVLEQMASVQQPQTGCGRTNLRRDDLF